MHLQDGSGNFRRDGAEESFLNDVSLANAADLMLIDPATASPARSGLAGVTVVADSCLLCDGLSTALFVMGLEEGVRFWRENSGLEFDVIFITDAGEIFVTSGLKDSFTLAEGETREVQVLE